jgi:hypothetical protein
MSWARLLKCVFDLALELCPNCGSELKIIAAILEQPVTEKILMNLGRQAPRSSGPALRAARTRPRPGFSAPGRSGLNARLTRIRHRQWTTSSGPPARNGPLCLP